MHIRNDCTRLWRVDIDPPQYLGNIGVGRILWRGANERVILYTHQADMAEFLNAFPAGASLAINHAQCGDPLDFEAGKVWARFENCTVRNKWIHKPVILRSDDAMAIELFVELNCKITMG